MNDIPSTPMLRLDLDIKASSFEESSITVVVLYIINGVETTKTVTTHQQLRMYFHALDTSFYLQIKEFYHGQAINEFSLGYLQIAMLRHGIGFGQQIVHRNVGLNFLLSLTSGGRVYFRVTSNKACPQVGVEMYHLDPLYNTFFSWNGV